MNKGVPKGNGFDTPRKMAGGAGQRHRFPPKIIGVPLMFVGLHAKVVLRISLPALRLLTQGELGAGVHEIGHKYTF